MDIGKKMIQIKNWIANDLTRAMIGNIPTSIDFKKLDSFGFQLRFACEEMICRTTLTQSDNRVVLNQQKMVCGGGFGLVTTIVNFGIYRLLKQIVLQIPNRLIVQNTKVPKLNFLFHNLRKNKLDFDNINLINNAKNVKNRYSNSM